MTELTTWFAESVGKSSILMKVDTLAKIMTQKKTSNKTKSANATKTSALIALSSVKAMYAMKGANLSNHTKNASENILERWRPATCAERLLGTSQKKATSFARMRFNIATTTAARTVTTKERYEPPAALRDI